MISKSPMRRGWFIDMWLVHWCVVDSLISGWFPGTGLKKELKALRHCFLSFKFFCIYFMACTCIFVGTHVSQCTCRGQRTTFWSQFTPSTTWVLGIELRSSDLAVSASTCWAILLAIFFFNASSDYVIFPSDGFHVGKPGKNLCPWNSCFQIWKIPAINVLETSVR